VLLNREKQDKAVLWARNIESKKTLDLILQSKQAYELRNPDDELKAQVNQLKPYLEPSVKQ